jgi:hypothetical protein
MVLRNVFNYKYQQIILYNSDKIKNYCLIDMGLSQEFQNVFEDIKIREHLIVFYDTEETKRSILFPFLEDGLSNNKAIIYICSDETPQKMLREFNTYLAIRSDEYQEKVQIKYYDDWYIRDGSVDPFKIVSQWIEAKNFFEEKGLGLRVAGETSCFFREGLVRELLRYEYSLHKLLPIEMEAMCMYNVKAIVDTGYEYMIMPLIRAHGKALFLAQGGYIVYEPEHVEDTDVETLLDIKIP